MTLFLKNKFRPLVTFIRHFLMNTKGQQELTRDQKHRIELARQFDLYREDYKKKLNPADYPGNLSLIFELDTRVCLVTTEDTTYVGELSSFDHFGNVILSKTMCITTDANDDTTATPCGILFFRAEQILMIGRMDPEKEKQYFQHSDDEE